MKKFMTFISTICVVALVFVLFTVNAFADYNAATPTSTDSQGYTMYTSNSYGQDFHVPYGTVVGRGNITSGYYVTAAQASLTEANNVINMSCDPKGIDGLFGPDTYNAIYNFQYCMVNYFGYQMSIDGYAGDQTWAQLQYWTQEY